MASSVLSSTMCVRSPSINFIQTATIDYEYILNETHLTVKINRSGDMSPRIDFTLDEKPEGSGVSGKEVGGNRHTMIGIGAPGAVIPRAPGGL